MRYKLATVLTYLWPVLFFGYLWAFSYYFVEWLKFVDQTQDKFQMAIVPLVFGLAIIGIFVLRYYYGRFVLWLKHEGIK